MRWKNNGRELLGLKLISRDDIRRQRPGQEAFRKYYYHGTSHMLGLDVHDVGNMHAKMAIGSLWTVEPGIYIKEEGFGVRLENNVVILKKGFWTSHVIFPLRPMKLNPS